ncbi:hypothetical protein AGOR_G00203760 [Albula goreensis]|uniref:Uncharacterized protein n=1 Tax=Albula goreensis TaxID=1534307 RepID=A0A8T3CS62_9TELE|nr:hypothetical protein AGOR_G00203760 [Albula goreensis]
MKGHAMLGQKEDSAREWGGAGYPPRMRKSREDLWAEDWGPERERDIRLQHYQVCRSGSWEPWTCPQDQSSRQRGGSWEYEDRDLIPYREDRDPFPYRECRTLSTDKHRAMERHRETARGGYNYDHRDRDLEYYDHRDRNMEYYDHRDMHQYDSREMDHYDRKEKDRNDSRDLDTYDRRNRDKYDSRYLDYYDHRDIDRYDSRNFDRYDSRKFDRYDSRNSDRYDSRDIDRYDPKDRDRFDREFDRYDRRDGYDGKDRDIEFCDRRNRDRYDHTDRDRYDYRVGNVDHYNFKDRNKYNSRDLDYYNHSADHYDHRDRRLYDYIDRVGDHCDRGLSDRYEDHKDGNRDRDLRGVDLDRRYEEYGDKVGQYDQEWNDSPSYKYANKEAQSDPRERDLDQGDSVGLGLRALDVEYEGRGRTKRQMMLTGSLDRNSFYRKTAPSSLRRSDFALNRKKKQGKPLMLFLSVTSILSCRTHFRKASIPRVLILSLCL